MTQNYPLSVSFAARPPDLRKKVAIGAAQYAVASGNSQSRISNGRFTSHRNENAAFNIAVACGVVLS
jgi:hypothetical protein